jgi:hypothetical protein
MKPADWRNELRTAKSYADIEGVFVRLWPLVTKKRPAPLYEAAGQSRSILRKSIGLPVTSAKRKNTTLPDFLDMESKWKRAKVITEQQTRMTEKYGEKYWQHVAGVFKKLMGLDKDGAVTESATAEEIHAAAHEAATSHLNDLPQPTEAQLKAGNYRHGHITLHGLDITLENPKGSVRSGIDPDGKPWSVTMPAIYGYFKRSVAKDGDHVDCYIGDHPESERVFIVDQIDHLTGKYDEAKVILGTRNQEEAWEIYCAGFSDGKGPNRIGAITEVSIDAFKEWLKNENKTKRPMSRILESAGAGRMSIALPEFLYVELKWREACKLTEQATRLRKDDGRFFDAAMIRFKQAIGVIT